MQKSFKYFITIIALLLLQACDTHADTQVKSTKVNIKLVGHYIYGHEVNVFQPCGQKDAFWVTGSEKLMSYIVSEHSKLTSQPYETVFIVFNGNYTGKATDGFAMDYDGQVNINKVIKIRKSTVNDCD